MSPKLILLLVALACYSMLPVESGRVQRVKRSPLDSAFKAKRFVIRLRRDAEPEETVATSETLVESEEEPIFEAIDWSSWLNGVVEDIEGVSETFNNHRLDFETLSKLDSESLQSIGLPSEEASKVVTKIALESWLEGVVSNDDIPFVIGACLENRITLESLQKLSLSDIASTGIALGDATRIYAKAHPEVESATTLPAAVDVLPNNTAPITINIVLTGADNTTTVASIQLGGNTTAEETTEETEAAEEHHEEEEEDVEEEESVVIIEPVITAERRSVIKRSLDARRKRYVEGKKKGKKGGKKAKVVAKKNKKTQRR